jgi:hypothetical protein
MKNGDVDTNEEGKEDEESIKNINGTVVIPNLQVTTSLIPSSVNVTGRW